MPSAVTASLAALYRNLIWDEANFSASAGELLDHRMAERPHPTAARPSTMLTEEMRVHLEAQYERIIKDLYGTSKGTGQRTNRRPRSVRFAPEPQRCSERSRPQSHDVSVGQENESTAQEGRTGDLPLDLVIERNRQELVRTSRSLQRMARRAERQLALSRAKEAYAAQRRAEDARAAQRRADKAAERAANGSVNRTAVASAWTPEQQRRIDASRAAYEANHQAWFEARSAVYAALLAEMPPPEQRRREDAVALFMTDPQAFLLARRGEWAEHDREMAAAREERRSEEERRERERGERRAARAATRASETSPPASTAPTSGREAIPATPPSSATRSEDDDLPHAEPASPSQDT